MEPPLEELARLRRPSEDGPAQETEEASLAAAIEAAFPSRGNRQEEPQEERRSGRWNRRRSKQAEGSEQRGEAPEQRPKKEDGECRPNRRRRRPRGGKNSASQN